MKKWAAFDGCDPDTGSHQALSGQQARVGGHLYPVCRWERRCGGRAYFDRGQRALAFQRPGQRHDDGRNLELLQTLFVGSGEPEPPTLVSAEPENRSFDLPSQDLVFVFTFDEAVDGGKAKVLLSGEGAGVSA